VEVEHGAMRERGSQVNKLQGSCRRREEFGESKRIDGLEGQRIEIGSDLNFRVHSPTNLSSNVELVGPERSLAALSLTVPTKA
jgi:hypothetical protein